MHQSRPETPESSLDPQPPPQEVNLNFLKLDSTVSKNARRANEATRNDLESPNRARILMGSLTGLQDLGEAADTRSKKLHGPEGWPPRAPRLH